MSVLDDVKTLLGSDDEGVLNIYIRRGTTLIINYLKVDSTVDIQILYPDAVIQYAIECYRQRGNEGIKQFSQGSRSGTLTDGLSQSVKDLLPLPKIRLMG